MFSGALAAPQHGPPEPGPQLAGSLPNLPSGQLPGFLKLLREAIGRHQEKMNPLFTTPNAKQPAVETGTEAASVVEPSAEVAPEAQVVGGSPEAQAEVIVVDPSAGSELGGVGLLAEVAGPSAVRLSGPPIAALKSKDRPTAGPPTQAQARADKAKTTPRPYSGYLPPPEPTASSQSGEPEPVGTPSKSYLPPPPAESADPSGQGAGEPEFTFTFESADGLIPPELLKHFASGPEGPDAPTGGTSRSTTSTWRTFRTYEFQHTAPGLGGSGSSQSGTDPSQSGFSGPTREITLQLPRDFPNIGAGLLGLATLGGPARGTGNLDQPAPGPDSLIPVEPQFARQLEDALALDALALDNPELNVVEREFNGATPVVSPAKVGEFVPDGVLFRENVEPTNGEPASANPAHQERIVAGPPKPAEDPAVGVAHPGNSVSSTSTTFGKGLRPSVGTRSIDGVSSSIPTFGKGLRPSVGSGSLGATGGGIEPSSFSGANPSSPSLSSRDHPTVGTHGSPDSGSVFPFRRDGPPDSNFGSGSFGTHGSTTTFRPFFGHNSFTTTTPRPFSHTTPSTIGHGTFSHTRPSTNFHNSFNQAPSANTGGTFGHTTPPTHSQGTFSQTRPATNFHNPSTQRGQATSHQGHFQQSSPQHTAFTQRPVTSAPGTFRPTHAVQNTFAQSTTHQRPFAQSAHGGNAQSTFSHARPVTHTTFTTTARPATHFQGSFTHAPTTTHQRPFTHSTQSGFAQTRPATNSQTSFSHSRPNTNFQTQRTFTPTHSPTTSQGTFSRAGPSVRPQATFIQINPQNNNRGNTFRHTGTSASSRPKAGPVAPVTVAAARVPNYNDPNFDSYAFYSDLRNLYGTPK